jgi:hypothetical protein
MIGSRPAMMAATVIIFGRTRSTAPDMMAAWTCSCAARGVLTMTVHWHRCARCGSAYGCATSAEVPSTIVSATDRCGLVANNQGNH